MSSDEPSRKHKFDLRDHEAETPFLRVLASSPAVRWEGVLAFHFSLAPVTDLEARDQSWPFDNLALHLKGKPNPVTFLEAGRQKQAISHPGSLCLYPRGSANRFQWTESAVNLSFGVVPDLMRQVILETQRGDPDQFELIPANFFYEPLLEHLGKTLVLLLQSHDRGTRLYAEALGLHLAHHLVYHHANRHQPVVGPAHMASVQVQRAIEHMHTHYAENIALKDLAAASGFSLVHFSRLFRKATGMSPYQYLIQVRLQRAHDLLCTGRLTVAEVAVKVGFYDQSHFRSTFKRFFGYNPGDLLKGNMD
ncbi:MAG: AraC family transcriptional regulator [bacterium]|nr:AraC family transcriptional regulator [bacterium]